jgi:hypothetical protein
MTQHAADERQPTTVPVTAEAWAWEHLTGVWKYHRAGWLAGVRHRALLRTYQSPAAWQRDFEAWAARPAR